VASAAQVPNPGQQPSSQKAAPVDDASAKTEERIDTGDKIQQQHQETEKSSAPDSAAGVKSEPNAESNVGWWGKLVAWFRNPKFDKEKIVKMGTSAVLAYGFVSNVNAFVLIIISWKLFTMKTGLSPLTQGQWGPYLLTYTALYAVIGNLLRPARFMLSAALSPYFEKLVLYFKNRFKVNQGLALGLTVFLVNGCLGISMLVSGLLVTSVVTGMPILPTPIAA